MPAVRSAPLLVALFAALLTGLVTGLPTTAAQAATVPGAQVPGVPAAQAPALTPESTTDDGWIRYRLAEGRLPQRVGPGRDFRGEIRFVLDGRERAVRVLVPSSARAPSPLLVTLHGLHQTVVGSGRVMGWGPVVRRHGVVLAQAVGSSASWAAGSCCGRAAADRVDDVAYLDRVVAIASALQPLHPRRLHLAGYSNGAMMAYRYACERRDRVAGVLAVSGTVTTPCRGRSDVAVLAVHGAADRTVPLAGTAWHPGLRTPLRPVSSVARSFGPRVQTVVVARHGHGWPTRTAGGYDATARGWAFLQAYPRR